MCGNAYLLLPIFEFVRFILADSKSGVFMQFVANYKVGNRLHEHYYKIDLWVRSLRFDRY